MTAARLEPHWHARTCFRRMRPETMDMTCSCGLDAAVDALAATPPTPSEPVGRVPEELRKWLLAVDKEHTGTVPGGLRLRHGRCTTCGMLKVGLDAHPTPATRDE